MLNFLKRKNIIFYIAVTLAIFLIFLASSGFSIPAFIITFAGAAGFYLVINRKQNTLFIYTSSLAVFFLIFYLVQIYNLPLWLALVFSGIAIYLKFYFFIDKELVKNYQTIYTFIAILIVCEIFASLNFLVTAILIKSLIITACFYFAAEVIKSNSNNKLKI